MAAPVVLRGGRAATLHVRVLQWISGILTTACVMLALSYVFEAAASWPADDEPWSLPDFDGFTLLSQQLTYASKALVWWTVDIRSWSLLYCWHFWYWYAVSEDDGCVAFFGVVVSALKSSFRAKVQAFALTLRFVKYLGVHPTIKLPTSNPVLYPVSLFINNLYQTFAPDRLAVAKSTYKRVNPTSELKLASLRKFDNEQFISLDAVLGDFIRLADEVSAGFGPDVREDLLDQLSDFLSVASVSFEGSSAAGFPFKSGTKRRDAITSARADAERMLSAIFEDGADAASLFKDYYWYTTGRAKLVEPNQDDSARLICYQAFALFLVMQKYAEPFTEGFVRSGPSWSAIGFSWFKRGACKLMAYFGAIAGLAPDGVQFASLDVSNWDAGLQAAYLRGVCQFHIRIIENLCGKQMSVMWAPVLTALYEHMIKAKVILPGGHVFELPAGMKSGWNLTSIDNTIIHEVIFRRVAAAAFGCVPRHKLYGDDNLFLAPIDFDSDAIFTGYAAVGCKVKYIHLGRQCWQVDFLSKYIYYDHASNSYYPYRPTVETDSRLIMPEHFNPQDIPAAEPVAAAEAILGHLIDNFFNREVRSLCYKMLGHIQQTYHVNEVDAARAIKAFRYKGLDPSMFRTTLPTVLDPRVISSLYGLPESLSPDFYAEANAVMEAPRYDYLKRVSNVAGAAAAEAYSFAVERFSVISLGIAGANKLKKALRYFRVPQLSRGTAGMKALEVLAWLSYSPSSILDFGGHPGSVACAILNAFPSVVIHTVSTMFGRDKRAGEAFMYKAPRSDRHTFEERSAVGYAPRRSFDHLHVDIGFEDIVDDATCSYSLRATKHWARLRGTLVGLAPSLTSMSVVMPALPDDVIADAFELFSNSSRFTILKPKWSHPWSTEAVMVFEFGIPERSVRKRSLIASVRAFRDASTRRIVAWSAVRSAATTLRNCGGDVPSNPLLQDDAFQARLAVSAGAPEGWFRH